MTHRLDPNRYNHSRSEWTGEYPTFPKAPELYSPSNSFVISRILVSGFLLLCRGTVGIFYSSNRLGLERYISHCQACSSMTLSCLLSLSSVASSRSSRLHLVSALSFAGQPTLARPYAGVHERTLLMSSFLLLSFLNGLWNGRRVAIQLLFCGVLLPGFV